MLSGLIPGCGNILLLPGCLVPVMDDKPMKQTGVTWQIENSKTCQAFDGWINSKYLGMFYWDPFFPPCGNKNDKKQD